MKLEGQVPKIRDNKDEMNSIPFYYFFAEWSQKHVEEKKED